LDREPVGSCNNVETTPRVASVTTAPRISAEAMADPATRAYASTTATGGTRGQSTYELMRSLGTTQLQWRSPDRVLDLAQEGSVSLKLSTELAIRGGDCLHLFGDDLSSGFMRSRLRTAIP
jgi:hypothetical protein